MSNRQYAISRGYLKVHSLENIEKGIWKYHEEHGKTPSVKSGDASLYVEYRATWVAVDQWLRKNGHGSLSQLCQEMGLAPLRLEHDLKAIKAGIRKYHKEHGKTPTERSANANSYVGYQTTWMAVTHWLRKNKYGSLLQICQKMGLAPLRAEHNLEAIKSGVRKYHEKHEKVPGQRSGDATSYLGYKTRWENVNDWLKRNGHGSLSELCKEIGLESRFAEHRLKTIERGIRKYHKEHGKTPSQGAGDASPYLGYKATWAAVNHWLNNNGHGSLSEHCKEMGFASLRAEHSLKAIQEGIRKYYKEHGKTPTVLAGEAKPHIGYKTNWMAVDRWLRKNEHGSLSQLCKKIRFAR